VFVTFAQRRRRPRFTFAWAFAGFLDCYRCCGRRSRSAASIFSSLTRACRCRLPISVPSIIRSSFPALSCYSLKPGPPAWSIFVELVISLLLPAMWIIFNGPMKWALVFGCAAASGVVLPTQHHWNFFPGGHVDHLPGAIEWGVWAIGYSG
jgi:hypothetical protein